MASGLQQPADLMSKYVLPIYRDDYNDRPLQVASAFMVSFQGSTYVVTAAHVLDQREAGDLYFYSATKDRELLVGQACVSGKGLPRSQDPIDVGVVRLPASSPKPPFRQVGREALGIHQLLCRREVEPDDVFSVIGYPNSRNKFNTRDGEVRALAYAFFGRARPLHELPRLPLSAGHHMLLAFDRNLGFDGAGKPVKFPKPQGMSGGPIFLVGSSRSDDLKYGFPVVGLATDHRESGRAIQATKIDIAVQFIGELAA